MGVLKILKGRGKGKKIVFQSESWRSIIELKTKVIPLRQDIWKT